jgi:methylmalonyl-CoA mutase N-terminal domain/subunit
VRVALQALAAVMGGTQSLHTNSMDEALWLPTEKSVRVALRTQQVIGHESGVADTIDPLAGSYFVEYLTDEISQRANEYIRKIDEMGGALAAIENGYMQNEIQEAAYHYQREIEEKEQIVVGVNAFQVQENLELERVAADPAIEQGARARLAEIRAKRDSERVAELLAHLDRAARSSENLMPLLITCVDNSITLGEVCGVLRKVWGEYQAPAWG